MHCSQKLFRLKLNDTSLIWQTIFFTFTLACCTRKVPHKQWIPPSMLAYCYGWQNLRQDNENKYYMGKCPLSRSYFNDISPGEFSFSIGIRLATVFLRLKIVV